MSFLPATQNKRRALVRTLMVGLGLGLVGIALAGRVGGIAVHWPLLAVLVAFCVLAVLEFATFDDVAKQAHYIAWYWGSLVGLVAIALIQVTFAFTGEPFVIVRDALMRWFGDADPMTSFLGGMMVTPLFMALGFFVVRGIDWLRSR
jgi:hypothetical protein